ncbi:hypothetical protein SAMN05421829_10259 [Aromatoleum tolulyticum]|uniref:Surface-adhesin protein E-like domain-containing protein n=2 Tax=Aromatoleum tolulyticum TaxID=34027 RepID=A0A1N6PI54_9RHOO|nr:hypothetical protein SAMN05421829_10259 [Aromatoleum tolulyticum]
MPSSSAFSRVVVMLLTTVVLCVQCERATAEWVEVRKHPVSTIYIDPEIARYDNDIWLAWMLADFSPPYKNPLIQSSRFQMAYDCKERRARLMTSPISYSGQMASGTASAPGNLPYREWKSISAGSLPEMDLNYVCTLAAAKASIEPVKKSCDEASGKLCGTWILDAAGTEKNLTTRPRPSNSSALADALGVAGGWFALVSYEFDGDQVVEDAYGGDGKRLIYRLDRKHGAEFVFVRSGLVETSAGNTLTVMVLEGGQLRIVNSGIDMMANLRWKKSAIANEMVDRRDVLAAGEAWVRSLQNIVSYLRDSPH